MNVCLCSSFRDSTGYIDRYFAQVDALHAALEKRADRLRVIIGEGDSKDATRAEVEQHLAEADYLTTFLDVAHGGKKYGSVVNAQRFAQLSQVWNKIWAAIPKNYSAVLFLESDIIWQPETMLTLLDCLDTYPAIAPMVLCPRINPTFLYDSWAFRKDGQHIWVGPPYFPDWEMQEPLQVDSAGSVLAMRGALAHRLTWPAEDVIVGVCRGIYELGESVWLHPKLEVQHP